MIINKENVVNELATLVIISIKILDKEKHELTELEMS